MFPASLRDEHSGCALGWSRLLLGVEPMVLVHWLVWEVPLLLGVVLLLQAGAGWKGFSGFSHHPLLVCCLGGILRKPHQ